MTCATCFYHLPSGGLSRCRNRHVMELAHLRNKPTMDGWPYVKPDGVCKRWLDRKLRGGV